MASEKNKKKKKRKKKIASKTFRIETIVIQIDFLSFGTLERKKNMLCDSGCCIFLVPSLYQQCICLSMHTYIIVHFRDIKTFGYRSAHPLHTYISIHASYQTLSFSHIHPQEEMSEGLPATSPRSLLRYHYRAQKINKAMLSHCKRCVSKHCHWHYFTCCFLKSKLN